MNAYQVFADYRCKKSTQVNDHHGLSPKEVNKIEQDGKEIGWMIPDNFSYLHNPSESLHYYIKRAIGAKLCVESHAKSSAIGTKLCVDKYAKIFSKMEQNMNNKFWSTTAKTISHKYSSR